MTNTESNVVAASDEPNTNGDAAPADPANDQSSRKRSRSGSRKPHKVPRADEKGVYPIESDVDRYRLLQMMQRNSDFAALLSEQRIDPKALLAVKTAERTYWEEVRKQYHGRLYGPGFQGYGNGHTEPPQRGGHPQSLLVYPSQKMRPGKRKARRLFVPRADMQEQGNLVEELIPVRLDIEHQNIKLRDTFTWNLHDYITNPEFFAECLVEDFSIPPESIGFVVRQVTQKIRDSVNDHYPHVYMNEGPLVDALPYWAYKNDEMRIVIKLNITIGSHTLVDQFEWDINNPMNSPEEFARAMARDMALSGEFTTAIAHSIREQSQMFTKSLYIVNHPFDGRPVEDADVADNFLQSPLYSIFRPFQSAKDFTPYLYELSDTDLQREELSILRDQRRQKRSTGRRGGPALPDLKDRESTIRSLVVSSVLPGAANAPENARLFKLSRTSDRKRRHGVEDSEESEDEDSDIEQEVIAPAISSTRGRLVRGAASAAQQAMRAGYRSQTPEVSHVVEPRASVRREREVPRFVEQQIEDTPSEPASLIVRLRLPKDIFRQWAQNTRTPLAQVYATVRGKPLANGAQKQWTYTSDGRVDVTTLPAKDATPPPPPKWLEDTLTQLKTRYPHDSFHAEMRLYQINPETNAPFKADQTPQAGAPPKYQYLPRIRCNDCPGKVYSAKADPQSTVDNFEVHLKNRVHKENVASRRNAAGS